MEYDLSPLFQRQTNQCDIRLLTKDIVIGYCHSVAIATAMSRAKADEDPIAIVSILNIDWIVFIVIYIRLVIRCSYILSRCDRIEIVKRIERGRGDEVGPGKTFSVFIEGAGWGERGLHKLPKFIICWKCTGTSI